jgi:hypothetical protein
MPLAHNRLHAINEALSPRQAAVRFGKSAQFGEVRVR